MNWVALLSSAVWVDFIFMFVHKFIFKMTNSLSVWYANYGMTAVTSDVLVIVLGVAIAQYLLPTWNLITSSITVQVIHDILFYLFVIRTVPSGQNAVIDLFKRYSAEGSWQILVADSAMIGLTVIGMQVFETMNMDTVVFAGLLAIYALTYLVYTK